MTNSQIFPQVGLFADFLSPLVFCSRRVSSRLQSYYVDKEKEKEKMYDGFRMVHGMEVGGRGTCRVRFMRGGFLKDKRLTKPEHSSFYTGLHGCALLDVSFTLIILFF
jgi:hypothetical protein